MNNSMYKEKYPYDQFIYDFEKKHQYYHQTIPSERANPFTEKNKERELPKIKKRKRQSEKKELSIIEKSKLFMGIGIVAIVLLITILFSAMTSAIVYVNEQYKKENSTIQGEIDYLKVQLEVKNNTKKIEEYAVNSLGMIYPDENYQTILGDEAIQTAFQEADTMQ